MRECEHIVHAGDVGNPEVLDVLRRLAPLTVVRGNNDSGTWASALAATAHVTIGRARIYVLHDIAHLDLDPAACGYRLVVSGHSHRPAIETRAGVVFVNPGSAGPRRFRLPVTVAVIEVDGGELRARIVSLLD